MSRICCRAARPVGFCTLLGALVIAWISATVASAAPVTSFLAVDVNGYNAGGGQTIGPTEAGFQGWEMAEGLFLPAEIDWGNSGAFGLTKIFPTSAGNITANMIGVVPNSFRGARNRGANTDGQGEMTQDFIFAQRDSAIGFGRNYIKLTLSGLAPNTGYEVTGYARDHFNGGTDSFQAWTDLAALGGLDGPGAWLDANVGVGASYQPAPGGVNNPIPTLVRSITTGPAAADPFAFAATFPTITNASGVLTVYTWSDPNTLTGTQVAALMNGFQVGIPEPGTGVLGLAGVMCLVRRRRVAH